MTSGEAKTLMRANSRNAILHTARKLLPRHGYNGISIRAIASSARLSTGAIYFHFKNKKEIYRTICIEAIDALIRKFKNGIEKKPNPGQKLISTFDSYISFFYERRDHYNILMEYKAEYSDRSSQSDEVLSKMTDMLYIMRDVIKNGTETGHFRKIEPMMLSIFLASVAEGMLQYKKLGLFDHLGISDVEFRKFMADITWAGIMPSYYKTSNS
jgi:AcrR family transcriptional regulator